MYHTHENGVKSWNKIGMEILYKTFSSNLTLRRTLMKEEWTILWYDIDLN